MLEMETKILTDFMIIQPLHLDFCVFLSFNFPMFNT